jgi:hypothetical protein
MMRRGDEKIKVINQPVRPSGSIAPIYSVQRDPISSYRRSHADRSARRLAV